MRRPTRTRVGPDRIREPFDYAASSILRHAGFRLADQLISNFKSRKTRIGVVGLGYVGLPLCGALVAAGLSTIGLDVDPEKVESIASGKTYIKHLSGDFVRTMRDSGLFSATTNFAATRKR